MDSHNPDTDPRFMRMNLLARSEVVGFIQRCRRITRTRLTWTIG